MTGAAGLRGSGAVHEELLADLVGDHVVGGDGHLPGQDLTNLAALADQILVLVILHGVSHNDDVFHNVSVSFLINDFIGMLISVVCMVRLSDPDQRRVGAGEGASSAVRRALNLTGRTIHEPLPKVK